MAVRGRADLRPLMMTRDEFSEVLNSYSLQVFGPSANKKSYQELTSFNDLYGWLYRHQEIRAKLHVLTLKPPSLQFLSVLLLESENEAHRVYYRLLVQELGFAFQVPTTKGKGSVPWLIIHMRCMMTLSRLQHQLAGHPKL